MEQIPVKTPGGCYSVTIDCSLLERLNELVQFADYSGVVIVTDENVAKHWLNKVLKALHNEPLAVITLPSGEENKSLRSLEAIWKKLLECGADRKTLLLNLGGGMIGDLAGFAAASYMRGVDFIQLPTTLLSQVDASIGGKVGVNLSSVKNIVGAFSQPQAVIIDPLTLTTLPERELISGISEMLKHGFIADAKHASEVVTAVKSEELINKASELIAKSCRIKANIVESDEREAGPRKLLNFGHTAGHALETLSFNSSTPLLHGEAVALGMLIETRISVLSGLLEKASEAIVIEAINQTKLPTKYTEFTEQAVLELIRKDKKRSDNTIQWTLLKEIGSAVINQDVSDQTVVEALSSIK